MDIGKSESIQIKEEVTCHEIIDNNIKIEAVKDEPWDLDFIKCELCTDNSDGKTKCLHHKNNRLANSEHNQDDKLKVLGPCSSNNLQTNSSHQELKSSVVNTEFCSVHEDNIAIKQFGTEITVKEENHLDSPEYVSTNMEFVKLEECQIKNEDEDYVYNEDEIERVKEEPTDNESISDILTYNNEDIKDSEGLQNDRRPKRVDGTNQATFQCKVCSIICPARSSLALHERIHSAVNPFRCTVCTKSFVKNDEMIAHENTHIGQKRISCNVCSKSFMGRTSLLKHERTHTGEKPFCCKICNKSYAEKSYMVRHERTHTGEKPYNCKVCSKPISDKSNLIKHEKTHIGEKPFNCKTCSKLFSSISHLVRHEKMHTGVKPFRCEVCSKSFFQRCNLQTHERIHTGENPFQCKVCEKSFAIKHCLTRHERTHWRKTV